MSKKLPPYGKSVLPSSEPVWVFAGFFGDAYKFLKHRYANTLGIFLYEDPENYFWPVKGREVILFNWHYPQPGWAHSSDEFYERLALTLFRNGADGVVIYNLGNNQQINHKRS